MTGFMVSSGFFGCKKNTENNETENSTFEEIVEPVDDYAEIKDIVSTTNQKVDELLPEVNDEISRNTSIVLLLELFTQKDENGKINADLISQFKSKLDVDNMISDFNAYLDLVQKKAIDEGNLIKVSSSLPDELSNNIIMYSNASDSTNLLYEFYKIYSLIVDEKSIEANGIKFEIRDLSFPSRAVANNLAEIAAYYSRNYITQEQYDRIDKRANDQNNKAYIKQDAEILNNQIIGISETDVVALFNKKYEGVKELLSGKVNLSDETIKNLINYINIEYLNSDRVSTKDMNQIIGEYDEDKVNDVLFAIDAINTYNLKNNKIISYSSFLVDNYLNTDTGKTDSITLDFIQNNTLRIFNYVNDDTTYDKLNVNPYFKNIKSFIKWNDFTHIVNGKQYDILYAEVSDGVKLICNETILYTLNQLPKVENMDNYLEISNTNLSESLQYLQNTITGECKRIDGSEYTLTK